MTIESEPRLVPLDLLLRGTDGTKLMTQVSATADVLVILLSAYR